MKLLEAKQLGQELGYCAKTIHKLRHVGLPAHRPPGTQKYKFDLEECRKWMKRQ